ncbi:MAG TPA: diaminopimelate epimerase [Pseudonocardiaceae bacterium]|nr:diaminopimelate epimerase [Pseudonocardiaceae bacterium]
MQAVAFAKGHGTGNDFVVLPDPDASLDLTSSRVRALCDRHGGLGADGVLRVVRSGALGNAAASSGAEWFMDYRNADGSIAEMCGNGLRLFARYLVETRLAPAGELVVGTRAGTRPVRAPADGEITVDMGHATVTGSSRATVEGQAFEGIVVDVGNPHLACVTDYPLSWLDLSVPPGHDPAAFPHGVNVEFVSTTAPGVASVRVHERGVGETRSCGTGTVAAVVAVLRSRGDETGACAVDTPGGRLHVEVDERTTRLTGPALIVARGELDPDWWLSI